MAAIGFESFRTVATNSANRTPDKNAFAFAVLKIASGTGTCTTLNPVGSRLSEFRGGESDLLELSPFGYDINTSPLNLLWNIQVVVTRLHRLY